jgi:hypothetical protein
MIVFNRTAESWWSSLVAMGRYKHVRAFGYVAELETYVFYDVQFGYTSIEIARGACARQMIAAWCGDADVLAIDRVSNRPAYLGPMLCTTAIARLIGLSGRALRPDALWRECIKNGAIPVGYAEDTASCPRSHAAGPHEDGAAAADAGPSD